MLKKKSIIFALVLAVLAVGAAFAYVKYVYPKIVEPAETYAKARNLYNGGNYMKAALELESIRDYSNSSKLAKQAWKLAGDNAYNEGKFDLASSCYEKAGADETDVARMDECYLRLAENAFANNRLSGGEMYLQCVSNAPGNADRIDALRMNTANSIMDSGLSADNIESAVDRLKLCSETASPQIMDMLVNRGRDALSVFNIDAAYKIFDSARRFCTEDGMNALNERINSEWTEAGLSALERGMGAVAQKCFDISGYIPEMPNPDIEYAKAQQLYENGDVFEAYAIFRKLGDYENSAEMTKTLFDMISRMPIAGPEGAYAMLSSDGKVTLYGDAWESGEPNWTGVKQAAIGKTPFILAVGNDGRVRSAGRNSEGCTDVSSWDQVIMISCGGTHSMGLRADGTVLFAGLFSEGSNNTASWREIVYIASGMDSAYGVTQSGRVIASGSNTSGQCEVSSWTDIKAVSAGNLHAVGLKADGTVVACGDNTYGQCNVSAWSDIVLVAAGAYHTIGLKADGTLLSCGKNDDGECAVSRFSSVAAVSAGSGYTFIVFDDGTNRLVGNSN